MEKIYKTVAEELKIPIIIYTEKVLLLLFLVSLYMRKK